MLSANRKLFQTWPESTRLRHVSLSIIATFRDRKGKFLEKYPASDIPAAVTNDGTNDGDKAIWYDVGDAKAIEWTSKLLNGMFQKSDMVVSQVPVPAAAAAAAATASGVPNSVSVNANSATITKRTGRNNSSTSPTAIPTTITNTTNSEEVLIPKPVDVLWARGLSQHPGNLMYRKMVLASMQDQSVLKWDETKLKDVSKSIVTTIKLKHNGRFLKTSTQAQQETTSTSDNMKWYELSFNEALEKTLVALREAREKLLRHIAVKEKELNVNNTKHQQKPSSSPPKIVVAQRTQSIASPGETDVVFGAESGTEGLKHPGNQVYRSLVSCNTGRYRSCTSKEKKLRICQSVVAAIKGQEVSFWCFVNKKP